MSAIDHPLRREVLEGLRPFNQGAFAASVAAFSDEAVFVAPGQSAVAGTYRGRTGISDFFNRLYALSDGSLKVEPMEVLANDRHMVLFLHFTGRRDDATLDVVVAGFHRDRGPDGWRRATFLPDDQAAFDRFFHP
jgi:ketosteroid isomerase-like protein